MIRNQTTTSKLGHQCSACLAVLAFFAFSQVRAAELIVRQNGPGGFSTIAAAVTEAFEGDVLIVEPGSYTDTLYLTKSLTIRGAGPQHVIIKSKPQNSTISVGDGVNPINVAIEGVSVTSADGTGIIVQPYANLYLKNSVVADCKDHGIYHGSSGNASYDQARTTIQLKNCTIANNRLWGLHVGTRNYGWVYIDDSIIVDNYPSESAQCFFFTDNNGITLQYGRVLSFGKPIHRGHAIWQSGPIAHYTSDPRFVDESRGNYILRTGSVAINAGTPGLAALDPDGTPADLGAYGGPDSGRFWPYPEGGPLIRAIEVSPPAIPQSGKIKIKATGTTR